MLPNYGPLQRAFHEAFDAELTGVVEALEVAPGSRVLDVPCGHGFYTRRLARRLAGKGRAVGIDRDQAYLDQARDHPDERVAYQLGDAYELPCEEGAFDLAFSAMSFISIEDPVRALKEVRRVLAPGGKVAVLESDEHHHVLLTWPVDVEVDLQRAIRDGCGGRYSPARRVNRMLRDAGFGPPRKKTFAADRQAPFAENDSAFLTLYLDFLRRLIRPHLSAGELARFDRYADPDKAESLFRRPDAELTCLMTLHRAARPD